MFDDCTLWVNDGINIDQNEALIVGMWTVDLQLTLGQAAVNM